MYIHRVATVCQANSFVNVANGEPAAHNWNYSVDNVATSQYSCVVTRLSHAKDRRGSSAGPVNLEIFQEDVANVIKQIKEDAPIIFRGWNGVGGIPQTDLTWLCAGYSLTQQDFIGNPNFFVYRDLGTVLISEARLVRDAVLLYVASMLPTEEVYKRTIGMVFSRILSLIIDGKFPIVPMLAHQHMLRGVFKFEGETPIPYFNSPEARLRPGIDAISGIRSLLEELGVLHAQQPALRADALSLFTNRASTKEERNQAVIDRAGCKFLDDDIAIDDVVPFWKHRGTMNDWTLSDESFTDPASEELMFDTAVGAPGARTYWVDRHCDFFVVFDTVVDDVTHLEQLTAWLMTGRLASHQFQVHAKTRIYHGRQAKGVWAMQLHDGQYWSATGGICTGGCGDRADGTPGATRYKLSMNLVEFHVDPWRSSSFTPTTTLVLRTRVPDSVKYAMSLPGPASMDHISGALMPASTGKVGKGGKGKMTSWDTGSNERAGWSKGGGMGKGAQNDQAQGWQSSCWQPPMGPGSSERAHWY